MLFTALILSAFLQTAPAPPANPLPPFPTRTEASLYQQIGQCNADMMDMRTWTAQIIKDKDSEIAKLKSELAAAKDLKE